MQKNSSLEWRNPKDKPTFKELVEKYLASSSCLVSLVPGERCPRSLHIEFHGSLARIPSLKNSKIPGKNFTNPDYKARLKAMDALFHQEIILAGYTNWQFGRTPVHVLLLCGERERSFDTDNCMASIKDWLEPPTKIVGKNNRRGWGVGVIENDSQATGYPLHSRQIEMPTQYSTIIIRPFEDVKESVCEFVAKNFLIGRQNGN